MSFGTVQLLPGVEDLDLDPTVEVANQDVDGGAGVHNSVGHQLARQQHNVIEGCWSDYPTQDLFDKKWVLGDVERVS